MNTDTSIFDYVDCTYCPLKRQCAEYHPPKLTLASECPIMGAIRGEVVT